VSIIRINVPDVDPRSQTLRHGARSGPEGRTESCANVKYLKEPETFLKFSAASETFEPDGPSSRLEVLSGVPIQSLASDFRALAD